MALPYGKTQHTSPTITALIPVSDQVINIESLLKQINTDEIILAGTEKHKAIAKKYGAKWTRTGGNRALDFNNAAKHATGDVYVLIHQNTIKLPPGLFETIKKTMKDPSITGGAVAIAFDHDSWLLKMTAFLSNNYRMKLRKIPYCDQTIFVRSNIYKKMNGFKNMPIFEDTDFSQRLQGKLVFLKGPVITSAHRFVNNGILFHNLRNQLVKLLYVLRVPPRIIKRIYEWSL